jgi:hypothetical protein
VVGVINAGWDDAPHLSEDEKQRLIKTIPPYQIKARTQGIPMLGSGAIYPIDEDEIKVDGFEIPNMFTRGYGLDVGWNATAAVWCARDMGTDTVYVYDVYKRGQAEPAVHISAIQQRGEWPGYIDPSAAGAGKIKDGEAILDIYEKYLRVEPADNTVEAGIFDVYERLTTGRLKVFRHLAAFFEEFRLYRRDEKGKVVKVNDHIMDAMRYCVRGINGWIPNVQNQVTRYRGSL